ncbi:S41 family peptidase [Epilithonimonas caeni]|uniref:S41 family peptidase n=1 Tax=Epilithonimonas caeni TaxID=365343 RepID=UPI00047F9538|nr:S41 family peptidase [Epilithonimonas caeni]
MERLFLIFFFFLSLGISAQLGSEKWSEDIKYLQNNLTNKHYNLFALRPEADFTKELNNIIARSSNLTDFQTALKLQQALAKQGDTHTNLSLRKFINNNEILPLGSYFFGNDFYITFTNAENKELLGGKILAINDFDIKTVTDSLSTLFPNENSGIFRNRIPEILPYNQTLKNFGFSKTDAVKIKYEKDGKISEKTVFPSAITKQNRVRITPKTLTFVQENKRKYFEKKYFDEDKILYVLYNVCTTNEKRNPSSENPLSFGEFEDSVFKIIKDNKVDKLIFDMRQNGGGSSKQGREFVKKLSQNRDINRKGHLFVVLGRDTFSSAILNATDFQEETKAIFVGEETSGKPNHYGEIQSFELPNSKLKLTYSTYYFIRTKKKNINTIKPDHVVEVSFDDYINGIDPVFEFIKNYK